MNPNKLKCFINHWKLGIVTLVAFPFWWLGVLSFWQLAVQPMRWGGRCSRFFVFHWLPYDMQSIHFYQGPRDSGSTLMRGPDYPLNHVGYFLYHILYSFLSNKDLFCSVLFCISFKLFRLLRFLPCFSGITCHMDDNILRNCHILFFICYLNPTLVIQNIKPSHRRYFINKFCTQISLKIRTRGLWLRWLLLTKK